MAGVESDIGEQVGDSKRFTSHLSFHRGQMTSKKRRDQDGKRCMALCKVKKDNGDQAKGDYYEPRPKKLGWGSGWIDGRTRMIEDQRQ